MLIPSSHLGGGLSPKGLIRSQSVWFQVAEEQFIKIWLQRMEQDAGYATNMKDYEQDRLGRHVTVSGIIKSLARMLGNTNNPKSLITTFQNQTQESAKHIRICDQETKEGKAGSLRPENGRNRNGRNGNQRNQGLRRNQ